MLCLRALILFQVLLLATGTTCNGDCDNHEQHTLLQTRTTVDVLDDPMQKVIPPVEYAHRYTKTQVLYISMPIAVLAMISLGMVHKRSMDGGSKSPNTLSLLCLLQLVAYTNFTLMILESYELAVVLERGASFSGIIIGVYPFGCGIGSIMFAFIDRRLQVSSTYPRVVIIACSAFSLVGSLLLCYATFTAQSVSWNSIFAPSNLVLAARVLSGFGAGAITQFNYSVCFQISTREERPEAFALLLQMIMLGIGLGPLLSSLGRAMSGSALVGTTGIQSSILIITTASIAAFYWGGPALEEMEVQATRSEDAHPTSAVIVIIGCLLNSTLRAFVVSSLASATALLLEDDYGWSLRVIGVAVGATFLFTAPMKLAQGVFKDRFTIVGWVRVFAGLSVVSSMLLHTKVADILAPDHRGFILLVADAMVFSAIYLYDGFSIGIMTRHFMKDGSLLDMSTVMCVQIVLTTAIGRTLGPWFARWTIAWGGQNFYALQQVALTVCSFLCFEGLVCPWMKDSPWHQLKSTKQ